MGVRTTILIGLLTGILTGPIQLQAQCPPGNVALSSQGDVDTFLSNYPDCTEIAGDLTISSINNTVITDLTGLSQITTITGKLSIPFISNNLSFNGLENIQSVRSIFIGGGFGQIVSGEADLSAIGNIAGHLDSLFIQNTGLSSFGSDFPNLTSIDAILIASNFELEEIPSFPALTSMRDFTVFACYSLENLTIPENIETVDFEANQDTTDLLISGIYIQYNPNLETITCNSSFTSLHDLYIRENPALQTVSGFNNVDSIYSTLSIDGMFPSIFDSFHHASFIGFLELFIEAAEFSEPIPEMLIGMGQNTPTLELGAGGMEIATSPESVLISTLSIAANLTSSAGDIDFNGTFQSINGMETIGEIGGRLQFICPNLIQLPNMPALTTIGGNLDIGSGQQSMLTDLNGLNALTTIMGGLRLGFLYPSGNYALESLDGLDMLTEVGGGFSAIRNLPALTDISALDGLNSINGIFQLRNLTALTETGVSFPNLTTTGTLIIDNTAFASLPDFPDFTQCNGNLVLSNNPFLTNTDGFQSLGSIGFNLSIEDNPLLESVFFPSELDFSGDLTISGNTSLNSCNSSTVCMLVDLSATDLIENNGEGCNSVEEILASCIVSTRDAKQVGWSAFQPHPGELILTTDRELGNASIQLFDVQGKLHHDIRTTIHPGNTSITIPQLTRGIYFLQVSTPEYISSQKIWLH